MCKEYLNSVLSSQTLTNDSEEMKELRQHREEVESLIKEHYSPTIRYGGSKAKGTMIKEAYDLDVIGYFDHDDTSAGESLKDIYENIYRILAGQYFTIKKGSAIRLMGLQSEKVQRDFHIDVVPGRYFDDSKQDVWLYRSTGEKNRLKTNLELHIQHVQNSGVRDAIKLIKLWRVRNNIAIKHFVLELLVIDLLASKKSAELSDQLFYVWQQLRDASDDISVEDPANPEGNDLSELWNDTVRFNVSSAASRVLQLIENSGWEAVFGTVETEGEEDKSKRLERIAGTIAVQTKPWYHG